MNRCQFLARNLDDTDRLGQALAELVPDGTTIALCGTLGAGKTRLVQAIAAACGLPRETIVSPTFVLCQEYCGTRTIYHLDAYRLQNAQEFRQLGPEEFFQSPALTIIEWADRIRECLPSEHLEIHLEIEESDRRRFELIGIGERLEEVVRQLAERLSAA
jgi:tRNA threonylcarbamoyladenosine biosynthesis protein TsaE